MGIVDTLAMHDSLEIETGKIDLDHRKDCINHLATALFVQLVLRIHLRRFHLGTAVSRCFLEFLGNNNTTLLRLQHSCVFV
jgi:hypothetical protein